MLIKLKNLKIIKFNFETLPRPEVKIGDTITVKINFNVETTSISKIAEDKAKILTKFICHMESFSKFQIELECVGISKDIDVIISALSNKDEKKLPPEIMSTLINTHFYFVMPEIVLLAEKAKIPIPLPPLITQAQENMLKSKSSKPIPSRKKSSNISK